MQPVSAGASSPLLLLGWEGDEVGAAGSFLHGEEERTVAAHHIAPAPPPVAASALLTPHMEAHGPFQKAPVPLQRCPFLSVSPLVLSVHGEEAKHHQIEEGPDDGQPHQDVQEAEGHIGRLLLEVLLFLQGHKVPEADGGERDEAVVVRMEEAPSLKVGERCGSHTQRSDAGQEAHQDHVLHGHLGALEADALLGLVQEEADERVHPFSQTLEHDQSERNAQHGVEHAEDLSCLCAWCCVSITLMQRYGD